MAQYKDFNGANFGNGLGSSTTFKVINSGSNTGDIFLSGSGGYVNSPTGISKASLDAGINLKFSNDFICQALVVVENGECSGSEAEANWCVTPTPTSSPTQATYTITVFHDKASIGASAGGDANDTDTCNAIPSGNSTSVTLVKAFTNTQSNQFIEANDQILVSGVGVNGGYLGYTVSGSGPVDSVHGFNSSGFCQSSAECTS